MTTVQLFDSFALDEVKRTNDGYLAAFAKVARTGIQVYKGSELGRPDLATVRVYRPPEEVFDADAMHSMAHRPVTLRHPKSPVTAKNWKEFARGQTGGEVVRDGEFIRVPLVMMDQALIDAYERGTRELSLGYSTEIKWERGVVPSNVTDAGQEYDAVQTAIRGNHLAVVPVARGGDQLRIGDGACPECGAEMQGNKCPECNYVKDNGELPMKTFTIDGFTINVADDQTQSIIQKVYDGVSSKLKAVTDEFAAFKTKSVEDANKLGTELKAAQTAVQTKDGEIAVLKKQVEDSKITPEKLDVLVKDRADVIGKAKTLLDSAYVFDGKDIAVIRKDAVIAKLGDSAKNMADAAIDGAFAALTNGVKVADSAHQLADHINQRPPSASNYTMNDPAEKALEARDKATSEAWKRPAA